MKTAMKLMISENEWLEFNEYNDDPEHAGCLCCSAQLVYRHNRKKNYFSSEP